MTAGQKTAIAEHASQRSTTYGFLARVFRKELTPELLRQMKDPRFLGVLSSLGADLGEEFFSRPEGELLEELAVEYTRLFLGPGKHVSPHESVHHERADGDWGRHWGKATVDVKTFVETLGLKYREDDTSIPDHISVEFEMMQKLTGKEGQAWEQGNRDEALSLLKIEKMFIDDHLVRWIPVFCDKVMEQADYAFYREMAVLTTGFVEFEKRAVDSYISDAQSGTDREKDMA